MPKTGTILLISDIDERLATIGYYLESRATVVRATTGQQAMAALDTHVESLESVILDCDLADMPERDVLDHINDVTESQTNRPLVIALAQDENVRAILRTFHLADIITAPSVTKAQLLAYLDDYDQLPNKVVKRAQRIKIAIVNGSPTDRAAIQDVLVYYDTIAFHSGQSAIAYIEENPGAIQLVICHDKLADTTAPRFIQELQQYNTISAPMVLVTADHMDVDWSITCLMGGAVAFCVKPYDVRLVQEVEAVLHHEDRQFLSSMDEERFEFNAIVQRRYEKLKREGDQLDSDPIFPFIQSYLSQFNQEPTLANIREMAEELAVDTGEPHPKLGKKNVLIIEDNATTVKTLKKLLGSEFTPIVVENLAKAHAFIHGDHEPLSAVILDIALPDGMGYDFIPVLNQKLFGKSHVGHIIVFTAYDDLAAINKSIRRGAYQFLRKSTDADKLLPILKDVVGKSFYLSECSRLVEKLMAMPMSFRTRLYMFDKMLIKKGDRLVMPRFLYLMFPECTALRTMLNTPIRVKEMTDGMAKQLVGFTNSTESTQ